MISVNPVKNFFYNEQHQGGQIINSISHQWGWELSQASRPRLHKGCPLLVMFDAHYFRQEQRGCLGGYASLRNFKRVKTTVLPILLSTRILNIRVSACHSSLLRPAIVEGERKMPQYTYCHLNDRRQSLRPVSHWWRKVHATFFFTCQLIHR